MVLVVLDASVALRVAAEADGFALLDGHELLAPALVLFEMTSALHEAQWRRDVSPELADLARRRWSSAPVQLVHDLHDEAWQVAERLGWAKTYDAEYVALARRLSCALLTVDARLARGAVRLVTVLTPAELPSS